MIGNKISHYEILAKLGEGGMGVVYLAQDTKLDRKVALKLLSSAVTLLPDSRDRFLREAKAAAKLNHPNIITIYEIGEYKDQNYIAMEFIEGESLKALTEAKELSVAKIVDITCQICAGLHEAHQAGIVHRDIKPENVLLDKSDRVKVLDFGLAKLRGATKITDDKSTLGTTCYMSPEQCQNDEVDHRSDIWSMGVVLYEMVTKKLPFFGEYQHAIIYSIINESPEPLARYKRDVPDALQAIVDKALDKDKETRYQNINDMLADLKRIQKTDLGQIQPAGRVASAPADQERILGILLDYYQQHEADPKMVFAELCKKIHPDPSTLDRGIVRKELFKLKNKKWVNYEFTDGERSGFVWIERDGARIARSLQPDNDGSQVYEPGMHLELCPASLGELIQKDPICARIIQREDLQREIIRYITDTPDPKPNHIVVYGQPMVGKTKFLEFLTKELAEEYLPLMITGQGLIAIDDLNAFLFDLAVQMVEKFNKWASETKAAARLEPPNVDDFTSAKGIHAFKSLWHKMMKNAGTKKPFVIFDEIEHLLDYHKPLDQRILNFLDEFIRDPDNGYFILAGSEKIRQSDNEQFSMLIGRGQLYPIRCFEEGSAREIFSAIKKYVDYEEPVLENLITLCDGHPRIIHNMYESVASFVNKSPAKQNVTSDDFDTILTMLIDRSSEVLWALRWRLTEEEKMVLRLVSRNFTIQVGYSQLSIAALAKASQDFPELPFDLESLRKGVIQLEAREWVQWINREKETFRVKLVIFPLWLSRNHIDLN